MLKLPPCISGDWTCSGISFAEDEEMFWGESAVLNLAVVNRPSFGSDPRVCCNLSRGLKTPAP